jgi:hypothetical protein
MVLGYEALHDVVRTRKNNAISATTSASFFQKIRIKLKKSAFIQPDRRDRPTTAGKITEIYQPGTAGVSNREEQVLRED